jgi:hypothetical protein
MNDELRSVIELQRGALESLTLSLQASRNALMLEDDRNALWCVKNALKGLEIASTNLERAVNPAQYQICPDCLAGNHKECHFFLPPGDTTVLSTGMCMCQECGTADLPTEDRGRLLARFDRMPTGDFNE